MNPVNQLILKYAKELYNVKFIKQITLGHSGNKIFEVADNNNYYILRASEYSPSKKVYIEFETKWMSYLSNNLNSIVKPLKSVNNNLLEVVHSDNNAFILSLFEKAPGKMVNPNNPIEFNPQLFFNLGMLMGRMHKLTIEYDGNIRIPDFEWNSPVNSWRNQNMIEDETVRYFQKKYYDEICSLPIEKENYGIIHWDIHIENFFVDKGEIKLFDFDAFQFNWYAADIASAIFFMIQKGAGPLSQKTEKERSDFAETYLVAYLKGYLKTNKISDYWIKKIDLFMKYQMADEYLAAQNYWPKELMHLRQFYLNWHKERISKELPYAFIDYNKVINTVSTINSFK